MVYEPEPVALDAAWLARRAALDDIVYLRRSIYIYSWPLSGAGIFLQVAMPL